MKRGIKQSVLAGSLSRKLGAPVRLIEDRLVNLAGGDAHWPDRIFDTEVAFTSDGIITSLKIRAIDDAGAYPGRGPYQLAKPITAITGPYRINSVRYEAISISIAWIIAPDSVFKGSVHGPPANETRRWGHASRATWSLNVAVREVTRYSRRA